MKNFWSCVKCMRRAVVSLLLSASMLLPAAVPAFAAEVGAAGNTGNTPVELTAEASVFDVTVPTQIAFHIDNMVQVTCPDNLSIVNRSAGPVEVTGIEVQDGAWTMASYNNGDRSFLAAEKVGANKLGLAFTPEGGTQIGTTTDGTQSLSVDVDEWLISASGGVLVFDADAIATAVNSEIVDAIMAANVVFTIGWNKGYVVSPVSWFTVNSSGNTIRRFSDEYDPDTCGTDIVIPSEINGTKIIAIGEFAFDGYVSGWIQGSDGQKNALKACKLTSVVIPEGVVTIGQDAFRNTDLSKIYISKSVTSIAYGSFDMCDKLTDVYYGGSQSDWDAITIGSYNTYLTRATIHYNS